MAKRFIDTNLFDDPWFMELSVNDKVFFIYCITNCDHAGILNLNPKLAEFQTGIKGLSKGLETVINNFDNRLISLGKGYYFLPSFLKYQYPKTLNIKVKAQLSVINRLKEFNLYENSTITLPKGLSNPYQRVQDKDKDNKEGVQGKPSAKNHDRIVKQIKFPESLNTPEFQHAFKAWADVRRDIRKYLTPAIIKTQLEKLETYPVAVSTEALRTAAANGWQGVFPESTRLPQKPVNPQNEDFGLTLMRG